MTAMTAIPARGMHLSEVHGLVPTSVYNHLAKVFEKNSFVQESNTMTDFVEWLRDTPGELVMDTARPAGERGPWTNGTMGEAMGSLCKVLDTTDVKASVLRTVSEEDYARVRVSLDQTRRTFMASKKKNKSSIRAGADDRGESASDVRYDEEDEESDEGAEDEEGSNSALLAKVKELEAAQRRASRAAARETLSRISRWLDRCKDLETAEGLRTVMAICQEEVDGVIATL